MPRINMPDLGQIADPFAVAPAGTYRLRIADVVDSPAKSGAPMLKFMLTIVGGDAPDANDHAGKNIFDYVVYGTSDDGRAPSNLSLWRLRSYCEAAGVEPTDFDPAELLNAEVDAEVAVEPGTDEYPNESNRIAKVYTR